MFPLFKHQEEAIDFLVNRPGFPQYKGCGMLAHDPGLGKTRTALEAFEALKKDGMALLVIAPISLLEAAWHEDLEKFMPKRYAYRNLNKFPLALPAGIQEPPTEAPAAIYSINYEFFQYTDKVQRLLPFLRSKRWMAVLDESSKIKNHSASQTKNLLAVSRLFDYRVVMSGTPAPNIEWEYWSQLQFACPGVLPKSFNQFRNTYFHLEGRAGQPIDMKGVIPTREVMSRLFSQQGAKYAITQERRRQLFEIIGPHIHARRKEDCLDLPDQVDEKRLVKMGPKQAQAYRLMKNHLVAEIQGQDVVAQVALAKLMKLREITSGFAFAEDGQLVETECPKMSALEEILDELGDKQVIIWGNFTWEIEKVVSTLAKRAAETGAEDVHVAPVVTLYGGTKDREASINDFISGRARYLVANPHSAAHGLTFVNCANQIFFSLDYSWESYEQARARTHRAGQVNKCTYFHLLAEGTIDEEILAVLRRKGNAQDIVFNLRSGK